jgi:hypothetical protein
VVTGSSASEIACGSSNASSWSSSAVSTEHALAKASTGKSRTQRHGLEKRLLFMVFAFLSSLTAP